MHEDKDLNVHSFILTLFLSREKWRQVRHGMENVVEAMNVMRNPQNRRPFSKGIIRKNQQQT